MSIKISPTQSIDKPRGGLIEEGEEEDKTNIDVDLRSDGNQVDININGTIVKATKRSIDITIGRFSISISNRCTGDNRTTDLLPPPVLVIAVLSVSTGKPLHVVTEDSCTSVTANLSLTDGVLRDDAHLLNTRSNGQGVHSLTAKQNTMLLAVDKAGNVTTMQRGGADEDEDDNKQVYATFQQEQLRSNQARFFVELGGRKHYLRVMDNGTLGTLTDFDPRSDEDIQTKFRLIFG